MILCLLSKTFVKRVSTSKETKLQPSSNISDGIDLMRLAASKVSFKVNSFRVSVAGVCQCISPLSNVWEEVWHMSISFVNLWKAMRVSRLGVLGGEFLVPFFVQFTMFYEGTDYLNTDNPPVL